MIFLFVKWKFRQNKENAVSGKAVWTIKNPVCLKKQTGHMAADAI